MRKLLSLAALPLCVALGGCPAQLKQALDLSPSEQANLDRYIALGNVVVKTSANFYCVMEPVTTQIVRVFDPSKGTASGTAKVDTATAIACKAALSAGVIVAGG